MTFKLNKRKLFTMLLAAAAAVCMALAISFLIPSSQTLTASADDVNHTNHSSGWTEITKTTSTLTGGGYITLVMM